MVDPVVETALHLKTGRFSWKVEDANNDTLQYTVYYKAVNESNWRLLKKELSKAEHEWDITTVGDGRYTVKGHCN